MKKGLKQKAKMKKNEQKNSTDKPSFNFEGRHSPHDPKLGEEARKKLKTLFTGHPQKEHLEAFARADRRLGLLEGAAIEKHLKEGCQECLGFVENERET